MVLAGEMTLLKHLLLSGEVEMGPKEALEKHEALRNLDCRFCENFWKIGTTIYEAPRGFVIWPRGESECQIYDGKYTYGRKTDCEKIVPIGTSDPNPDYLQLTQKEFDQIKEELKNAF